MKTIKLLTLVACLLVQSVTSADEPVLPLNSHLEVFRPLLGKTWRGEFANSTAEKPVVDISKWERILNGQAIRTLHSVNNGEYGGETIMMWDPKQEKIAFWYFTTAGFHTQGTMDIDGNTWTSIEEVTGNANGITKVKAIAQVLENGELHSKSEYFANDKWVPGHEVHYKQVDNAEPQFK
jgi:hypothetical protein